MKRDEYNRRILDKCSRFLQSRDSSEVYEGVVLAAYLIEQSFKSELMAINPLLYFDRRNISEEQEVRIALSQVSQEERGQLKAINARRCLAQMCIYKSELQSQKAVLDELFEMRNSILHSTGDLVENNSAAETAVSALRVCRKYVLRYSGKTSRSFNPLTSREFERLQEDMRKERINKLKALLKKHQKIFEELDAPEVSERMADNRPRTDNCTWIEETITCPACGQASFDKIGSVDFDWNPDGMLTSSGFVYQCRVCELELSEHELQLFV